MLKPIKNESVCGQVFWQLHDQILPRTWASGIKNRSENKHSRTLASPEPQMNMDIVNNLRKQGESYAS